MLTIYGCSTEKNAFINRAYHYTTTRFNGYFHGNEAYKLAVKNINDKHEDDYDNILEIYRLGDAKINKEQYSNLNRAINKAAKMIDRHSMKFKKKGESFEVNKMIDDCFLLIGKSRFLKYDLESAAETFIYVQTTYDKSEIKYDAALWLIQTYILQENFVDAESQLQLLQEDKEFPKKLKDELFTIEAMSYIKSKDFDQAAASLEKAISLTKKKKFKHRLSFILAQLYLQIGEKQKATNLFNYVAKKATDYDLQFNAKINLAKAFEGSGEEIIKIFEKMLKDEKNKEYKDQIFFALAQVYEKQGQTDLAIKNYKLAAATSVNNPKQKGKAYLALGNYYFDIPNYPVASAYYDSSLASLPPNFPNYKEIQSKNNSLTELVAHLKTVEVEDSLQRIAGMSEEDRIKFAEGQIEVARLKQEEKEAKAQADREKSIAKAAFGGSNGETWIFDNPSMLSAGSAEFFGIWGDIQLEDNWRRKDKTSISFDDVQAQNEANENADVPEDQTVDFYLKDIPNSADAVESSNRKIRVSYYALAVLYRDQFNDLLQSNHYFELLNSRYPKNKKEPEALYQLYRNYHKLKNNQGKENNKKKILADYPHSEYAQLLRNPNMVADQEKKKQAANKNYELTYNVYRSGDYNKTIAKIDSLLPSVKGNPLEPRYQLLKAFAIGNAHGKDSLLVNLKKVQSAYMGTTVANEIDLILGKINRQNDLKKAAELDSLKKEKAFKLTKSEAHFFVLIYNNKTIDSDDLAKGVSDFNTSYFKALNLKVKTIAWSETENILIVKPLNQEKDYYQYYTAFQENFLKKQKNLGDINFNISKTNYAKLFRFKDVVGYADYFKKNYFASEK